MIGHGALVAVSILLMATGWRLLVGPRALDLTGPRRDWFCVATLLIAFGLLILPG